MDMDDVESIDFRALGGTVLDFGDDGELTLAGVSVGSLQSEQFLLA
jgi:hypothetical protein